jgi:ribose transport system permease protein
VLLATNASFIAIMAVAMTAVIVLGGIDLSVGSIYALAAILGAMAMEHSQLGVWAVPMVLVVCCGVGAAAGAFNGTMIVGLRVHPFIITLGTMVVYKGIVFVTTRGQSIGNFPPEMTSGFFKAELFGVNPVPGLLMLLVVTVGALMLSLTVLGRRVYAIGGNETAATYAGIPVGRVKVIVYTLMGAATGLSAAVYLGYYGAAQPSAGDGYELRVIAAAVIGGASLSGGRGSAIGAVLGALVIQLIENAMIILGIDQSYNQIVMGAAIVAAVVLDQAKGRLTGPRR